MKTLRVLIDGQGREVPVGVSVAAALALTGNGVTRRSANGERRSPFCGMGVCQECRVTVNGRRVLACQTLCQSGMMIERSPDANL